MSRCALVIFMFLFIDLNVFAQSKGDDYYGSMIQIYSSNPDSAIQLCLLAQEEYLKEKNDQGAAKCENSIGFLYFQQSEFDKALVHATKAIDLAKKAGDTITWSKAVGNIGNVHRDKGDYAKASEYLFESLRIAESMSTVDYNFLAGRYLDASAPLVLNSQNERGLDLVLKGIEYAEKAQNDRSLANGYNSLAAIYSNLNKLDSAEVYLIKSIDLKGKIAPGSELSSLINLTELYTDSKEYKKAEKIALRAYNLSEEIQQPYNKALASNSLGLINKELNNYKEALKYFENARKLASEIEAENILYVTHTNLAEVYYLTGDYKSAYEEYRIYQQIKNGRIIESYQNEIAEAEIKYEVEKKEKANELLAQEILIKNNEIEKKRVNQIVIGLIFLAVIILLVAMMIVVLYRRKLRTEKQLQAQEKMRYRAVIEAEEKERIRIAKELHDGIGQLLSTTKLNIEGLKESVSEEDLSLVNNASSLVDTAVEEVRSISHNMMPAVLSMLGLKSAIKDLASKINDSGLLKIECKISELSNLDKSVEIAVYRVIQEFVNNIIKHANAKVIYIQLLQENSRLKLSITDDGKGFDVDTIKNSKGLGWKSIFSRIELLDGIVNVDSIIGKGTTLNANVPIHENK